MLMHIWYKCNKAEMHTASPPCRATPASCMQQHAKVITKGTAASEQADKEGPARSAGGLHSVATLHEDVSLTLTTSG